ncbi:MAG TPA: branched-chain amino acid ABC transporter permease [Hyphomicrobiales bacterium]|nr:branched-chain amino acid ABC transporter permease [Hyphomicrobiales bacterium]
MSMARLGTFWNALPAWGRILLIGALIFLVPLIIAPIEARTSFGILTSLNRALIFVVLALGLNIVVGFAGLLDLGYAAFFAIGAYTFGILTWPRHGLELGFFMAIWVCALVAAVFGLIIGSPTLRLRGDYLAIVTLAFGEIVPILVRNLDDVTLRIGDWVLVEHFNLTNGTQGMSPLGKPDLSFIEALLPVEPGTLSVGFDPRAWYFIIVLLAVIVVFASRRLEASRLGRAWKAMRDDETAANFMGVDPIRTKLLAFAIGASFSGLAGAIFASMIQVISYEMFRFQVSIFLLIIVILSGAGSIYGVLIGGVIISTFDTILLAQVLPSMLPNVDIQQWRWVFFGAGLVLIMLFRPQGLFGGDRHGAARGTPTVTGVHGTPAHGTPTVTGAGAHGTPTAGTSGAHGTPTARTSQGPGAEAEP